MKTSEPKPTKEEILAKWEGESADRLLDRFDYYERVIFPSMQEYAESYHNERLRKVATDIIITYHFTLPNNTVYLPENAEKAIKEYLKMKQ